MKKTGIFASANELKKMNKAWKDALKTPVMVLGGVDMAQAARSTVIRAINDLAESKGLKSSEEGYGLNPETGEFLEFDSY